MFLIYLSAISANASSKRDELGQNQRGHCKFHVFRIGTNGVSTNGITANFVLFGRGTFGALPLSLLLHSQNCQGVPLSLICQNSLLLQRPNESLMCTVSYAHTLACTYTNIQIAVYMPVYAHTCGVGGRFHMLVCYSVPN